MCCKVDQLLSAWIIRLTKRVMYCGMAPTQCFSSGKRLALVFPEVDRKRNEMKVKATYRPREQVTK